MARDERFAVFISSSMGELKAEREAVWAEIDANPNWLPFAFEFDAPASAKGARDLWLRELESTDVTVVLLWKTLGAWTKDEFDLSRELRIPVLVFIKLDETSPLRDSQGAFVADLENPETLGTPKYFTSLEDLNESVSQSIQTALHDIVRDRNLSPEGETLGNMRVGTPTDQGFSVKEAPGPKISPRDSGDRRRLRKNPRRRRFVGRVQEKRTLMLDIDSGDPLVVIVGPPGIGKKALLRELTWKEDLDPGFEDGAAVHPHYADTANLEDLLQAIWEEFYETDDPGVVLPSRRIRDLAHKETLIFVPDVSLPPDQVDELLEDMQDAVFCFTAEVWPSEGNRVSLAGFSDPEEVLGVFQNGYHAAVPDEASADIVAICALLAGHPGLISLLASRAADEAPFSPDEDTGHPLPGWAATKREMSATELRDWLVPPDQRRVVEIIRATGVHTPRAVVADVAGSEGSIDDAVAGGLAEAASPRYRVNAALTGKTDTNDSALMSKIFSGALVWANSAEPTEIYDDRAFVLRMLGWGAEQARWDDVLRLGKATEVPMALGGRHGAWEEVLEHSRNAARQMEPPDQAAEAWALHQLGSRALLRDDLGDARVLLHESLRRRPKGDDEARAVTRHNLGLIPAAIVTGGVLLLWLVFLVPGVAALIVGTGSFEPNLDVTFANVAAPATRPVPQEMEAFEAAPGQRVVVEIEEFTEGGVRVPDDAHAFCIMAEGQCVSGTSATARAAVTGSDRPCKIETLGDGQIEAVVPGEGACFLVIGFRPLMVREYEATLTLTIPDGESASGALMGTAVPPVAIAEIDREVELFTATNETKPIRIENIGNAPFFIDMIEPPDGFEILTPMDGCSDRLLSPGNHCGFMVKFLGGDRAGLLELVLTSDAGEVKGDDAILLVGRS